jgi:ATP-binding cassette subfamily B protein
MMRSFQQDPGVAEHRITRDTLKRILGFARPYRLRIAVFLGLIAVDAAIGAALPLVYRAIIDRGIARDNLPLVVGLAGVLAGAAIVAA